MRVDAHQHFWKITRGDYFWMDDSVADIRRDILPADLIPHAKDCGIDATVVVQAAPTLAETEYLLELAENFDLIRGVVGWVDLEDDRVAETLNGLVANPYFKGIRPMLQDIDDTQWVLQPKVLENLTCVAELGLSLDALVQPRHLSAIDQVAKAVPALRIVVDHCAKPVIGGGKDPGRDWRDGMATLAEHRQIKCKLSGLANEFGEGWSAEGLQPVFDHIIELFGPDKVMWGSDWPVLELAGTYCDWHECAMSMTSGLTDAQQQMVFGGTAARFYRLDQS